jgi:hypothetical protein
MTALGYSLGNCLDRGIPRESWCIIRVADIEIPRSPISKSVGTSEIRIGVGIAKKSCTERHRVIWFERVGICCGGALRIDHRRRLGFMKILLHTVHAEFHT